MLRPRRLPRPVARGPVLVLSAAALTGMVSASAGQDWWQAGGSVAFFFFFVNDALGRDRFVSNDWAVVGRFATWEAPILVALARIEPGVTRSEVPMGWEWVTSVPDSNGGTWTLFAALGRSDEASDWRTSTEPGGTPAKQQDRTSPTASDLARAFLNGPADRTVGDSTTDTREDRETRLRAMFRLAVIRADATTRQVPAWLHDGMDQPLADETVAVELFPRFNLGLRHHAAEDGSVLVRVGGIESLPSDLLGALARLRPRDFLPNLPDAEQQILDCERDLLDALVNDGSTGAADEAASALLNRLTEVKDVVSTEERLARQSAKVINVLRSVPTTKAESESLRSLSKGLDATADELRAQGRSLVQLAAPLAAEQRGRHAEIHAQHERKRTDRVIVLATVGAVVIGVPALVTGFFGATVKPLDNHSPFGFWDLLVATGCVALLTGAVAEVFLHHPKKEWKKWWWGGRCFFLAVPPSLAYVWMERSVTIGDLATCVTTATLAAISAGALLAGWAMDAHDDDRRG